MTVIAIIPGSFAPALMYNDFVDGLKQHGIRSVAIELPSVGHREGRPAQTMTDDKNEIIRVVGGLLDDGEDVVIMCHSYSGVPTSQSLEKLSEKARKAEGKKGVRTVVYTTSVILPVGASMFEGFMSSGAPSSITVDVCLYNTSKAEFLALNSDQGDFMVLDRSINGPLTFSDMSPDQIVERANQMDDHSALSFQEKLGYAGYNDVEDLHYIFCEEDKIIAPETQEKMIDLVKTTSGREPTVHKMKVGHAPMASAPDALAKVVKEIIA